MDPGSVICASCGFFLHPKRIQKLDDPTDLVTASVLPIAEKDTSPACVSIEEEDKCPMCAGTLRPRTTWAIIGTGINMRRVYTKADGTYTFCFSCHLYMHTDDYGIKHMLLPE